MKRLLLCVLLLLPLNGYATVSCDELHKGWLQHKQWLTGSTEPAVGIGTVGYVAYVSSFADTIWLMGGMLEAVAPDHEFKPLFDLPHYSYDQIMHIVGKYLEDNPKKWKNNGRQCMFEALILRK